MFAKVRGFTLIELILVVAIIVICAMVIAPLFCSRGSSEKAEQSAREFYGKLYPDFSGIVIVCTGSDSDSDGYMTCSGRGTNDKGVKQSLPVLSCAGGGLSGFSRQTMGCKETAIIHRK